MNRPAGNLTDQEKKTIYSELYRAHVDGSGTYVTLRHVVNDLPVEKTDGPYDIPDVEIRYEDIELRAMSGFKKSSSSFSALGEEIDCDLKLFIWLEDLERVGIGTTATELDLLTKDEIKMNEDAYEIVRCEPSLKFFGESWLPNTIPDPCWNRDFLSAKMFCKRKERR